MGQTIEVLKENVDKDKLPFQIINIRPDFSGEEDAKNRKSIQSELYKVFRNYTQF